jgi:hypothetical protein
LDFLHEHLCSESVDDDLPDPSLEYPDLRDLACWQIFKNGLPQRLKQVFCKMVVGDEAPNVFKQDVTVGVVCLSNGSFSGGQLGFALGVNAVWGMIHFDLCTRDNYANDRLFCICVNSWYFADSRLNLWRCALNHTRPVPIVYTTEEGKFTERAKENF